LAHALVWLAHVYPSAPVRSRIARAAAAVGAGLDWHAALAEARVVTAAEEGLLRASGRTGNLPWALTQIAARRERRTVYRLATALQILYPVAILLLGGLVGFYAVSLFVPLVQLIAGLSK
jgi:type IV pilus assembly protein PilC